MRGEDLSFATECTRREGWLGETIDVFRAFHAHDPSGCLIAEEDGRKVGICIAVPYDTFGFLGELIVVQEYRGRGIGRALLEQGIGYLQKRGCSGIYLDGDAPALSLYERIGFRHVCRSHRFVGRIRGRSHGRVRPIRPSDLDAVCSLDRLAFGGSRRFFLEYRLEHFPQFCMTLIRDEGVAGFIMAQPGHGVVSVGPWVVEENAVRPMDLLEALAFETGEALLRLGALDTSSRAVTALRSMQGFEEGEPSWRMVLGPGEVPGTCERIFAVGSAAKG